MLIPDQHSSESIHIPCSVDFDSSTTSDIRVHAPGWGEGSISRTSQNFFLFFFSVVESFIFEQQVLFRVDFLYGFRP